MITNVKHMIDATVHLNMYIRYSYSYMGFLLI